MPDWNPDREAHVKHKWICHNAALNPHSLKSVKTSKGDLEFDKYGRFMVSDEALAHEIRTSDQGKADVTVTRVRYPDEVDKGHTYFFGQMPPMPWHKYDEQGNRIES